MDKVNVRKQDQILMSLVHYFVTKEGYAPIFVQGVKDEIWLEKVDGPYRIIRINNNYIHNEEQYNFEQFKIKNIMKQIKRKTLSLCSDFMENAREMSDPDKIVNDFISLGISLSDKIKMSNHISPIDVDKKALMNDIDFRYNNPDTITGIPFASILILSSKSNFAKLFIVLLFVPYDGCL